MASKKRIAIALLFILVTIQNTIAQTNIGFLGKKVALGYSTQFSLVNFMKSFDVFTHNFSAEFSTQRYQSITLNLGYKKTSVPLGTFESQNEFFSQTYTLNGQRYEVDFQKMGGTADFRTLMMGIKVNFFYHGKTFAAPNGFCQYLKADIIKVKPIKNNYEYELLSPGNYSQAQIDNAKTPEIKDADVTVFNVGFGLASKRMLSRSVFLSINAEANINTLTFLYAMDEDYSYSYDINEDLKFTGRSVNKFKHLLAFGMGIGILL